ncbi:MAG: acetylxylan esterase [Bacteroidales bacterium]|nr:acetylxylan esterase [Bacteroidales bacterium]
MKAKILQSGLLCVAMALLAGTDARAQEVKTNFVEENVPAYELPDPLVLSNGRKVRTRRQWTRKRRPEILEIFSQEMYGHVPARPAGEHFRVLSEEKVYDGLGIRKTVRLYLDAAEQHWFDVLIHLPAGAKGRVPMFAGLNFKGNEATLEEDVSARSWPYEQILKAGFGVATAWRDSVEPDGKQFIDPGEDATWFCRDGGVRAWFHPGGDWGAISAWAWGLSRILDYLETDPAVEARQVAVIGHSRLGKTALWAGANDPRFAVVISNCSGCCGAAISRRVFGENFAAIDRAFPHWFTRAFDKYQFHEDQFPADQHWLAALAAPRPLYIVSADKDGWADPRGEWLCARNVEPVYRLFRKRGLSGDRMPSVPADAEPESVFYDDDGTVGYHIRAGKHALLPTDWERYLIFARRHFRR